MKLSIMCAAGLAGSALAFPSIMNEALEEGRKAGKVAKRVLGFNPGFDAAAQLVDVHGSHAWQAPGTSDLRGPCPGLNALANHNYLPHNGVATIDQFVQQTNQVFGMAIDLGTFLSVYGAAIDGDLTSWSIGGPPPSSTLLGLLAQPQGISGSHNKYESDASPTRGDLYQYGNDYLLQMSQWKDFYALQAGVSDEDSNYDLGVLTSFRAKRFQQSIDNNPYFFNGPFSGVAVQPAAYTFIYRFMANHSAENPAGQLTKSVLKSFFAITGTDDNPVYTPGYERIPENWYRRSKTDEYSIAFFALDLTAAAVTYPQFLSVGGNTGTTNSFTGVDITNLTGGVYSTSTLLQGNNLQCFAYQAAQQAAPDAVKGIFSDVTSSLSKLNNEINSVLTQLGCPQLQAIDMNQFSQFPGYTKSQ
ncbi:aromatic peroxygenase [Venturia nashicola]|uniref:Aromatic peroxygenase n=1 Tax=Venturia nashicola TaxID=86259 RepID=A0A4Z1PCN4_9PEZI|nr:aromatic peroxygenase [Venturia nashicola]TLD35600.1 aromatic peroxygenase [Venturia nashicola]